MSQRHGVPSILWFVGAMAAGFLVKSVVTSNGMESTPNIQKRDDAYSASESCKSSMERIHSMYSGFDDVEFCLFLLSNMYESFEYANLNEEHDKVSFSQISLHAVEARVGIPGSKQMTNNEVEKMLARHGTKWVSERLDKFTRRMVPAIEKCGRKSGIDLAPDALERQSRSANI